MLVKQKLITKVKDYFNLNVYETKVWLALLSKGVVSAGEVAEISGVPRSRTYDVLESLEKKGFVLVKLGKPVKYLGIKPKIVLEKLKNQVRKEADDKITSLLDVKKTEEFTLLEGLYNEGIDPVKKEDLSASLRGKTNISSYLKEILQNAEKEVIFCLSAREMKLKMNLFKKTLERLANAGIKIKIALSGDKELIKQLEKEFAIKIKQIDLNVKFFIIDKKEILFYLSKENSEEDLAIWLNSEFFSQAFGGLFEKALKNK